MHEGVRKLKLDKYEHILIEGQARALDALSDIPSAQNKPYDALITVVLDTEAMRATLARTAKQALLREGGMLFLLYPKKGNKQYEGYIHRDSIFEVLRIDEEGYFEDTTLKFNSMTAFDEVFTALGVKNAPLKAKKSAKPSQSVQDYRDKTEALAGLLDKDSAMLYQGLTPGYQASWARFVFSTEKEETRAKRLQDMKSILAQGYKSIDLWRKANK